MDSVILELKLTINDNLRAFGIAEEEAFCIGTGTGQPSGIFTATGSTVGVTAANATAITADELINLIYLLKGPYRRNAKFLMNDATVSAIRKLKDKNDAYLWQSYLQAGELDKLLGYDLYTSPYVPALPRSAGKDWQFQGRAGSKDYS